MKTIKEWDILHIFCLPHWFILHLLPLWDDTPRHVAQSSPLLIFGRKGEKLPCQRRHGSKISFGSCRWQVPWSSCPSLPLAQRLLLWPKIHILEGSQPLFHLTNTSPAYVCHRYPCVPKDWRASWFSKHEEISIPVTLPPNNPFSSEIPCLPPAFHPQSPSTGKCGFDRRYSERAADDLDPRKHLLWEELTCDLPHTFPHPPQTWETLLWSIFKEACCVLMKYFSGFKCYFL